jgi:hypothetical protein
MASSPSFAARADVVDVPQVQSSAMAHGITMGLAFAVFFPFGAVLIRVIHVKHTLLIHVGCQMIGWCLMIAGFASGMRLGNLLDQVRQHAMSLSGGGGIPH